MEPWAHTGALRRAKRVLLGALGPPKNLSSSIAFKMKDFWWILGPFLEPWASHGAHRRSEKLLGAPLGPPKSLSCSRSLKTKGFFMDLGHPFFVICMFCLTHAPSKRTTVRTVLVFLRHGLRAFVSFALLRPSSSSSSSSSMRGDCPPGRRRGSTSVAQSRPSLWLRHAHSRSD